MSAAYQVAKSSSSFGRWVVWVGNQPMYFWQKSKAVKFAGLLNSFSGQLAQAVAA